MKCIDVCVYGSLNLRVVFVVLGGFLIHLAIGGAYVFGNFAPYFISYLRNRTDDTTVRNVDALWVNSLGSVGNMIGMSIGGLLAHRFGPRITVVIGSTILGTSVAMTYFSSSEAFIMVVFTYGMIAKFGSSISYGTSIQTAIKWLPNHASLAAGLIASGTGLGSVIFNPVVTAYINPDNLLPDYIDSDDDERYFTQKELLDRVPMCFVILGSSYFALQFIGMICITDPPIPDTEIRIKHEDSEKQALLSKDSDASNDNYTSEKTTAIDDIKTSSDDVVLGSNKSMHKKTIVKQGQDRKTSPELSISGAIKFALRSRSFYIIWLTCFMLPAGMQFIIALYKAYGQTFIFDDHFLTLVGSVSAVFNCSGRPVWGFVMDLTGFRVAIICVTVGFAVCTGTLFLTEDLDKEWYLVSICLIYFFYGGIWAMMPSALAKLLGPQNMAINYGIITSGSCLATIIGSSFASTLKSELGWQGLFFVTSGMSGIVSIVSIFFNGVDRDGKKI